MACVECFIHTNYGTEMKRLSDAIRGSGDFIKIIKSIYHHLLTSNCHCLPVRRWLTINIY